MIQFDFANMQYQIMNHIMAHLYFWYQFLGLSVHSEWYICDSFKVLLYEEDLEPIWIYFRPKNFGTSVKSIYMSLQYPWNHKSQNDTNDL